VHLLDGRADLERKEREKRDVQWIIAARSMSRSIISIFNPDVIMSSALSRAISRADSFVSRDPLSIGTHSVVPFSDAIITEAP